MSPSTAIALVALLAAPSAPWPAEVVVQKSETLAQIAKRVLGDARIAAELKALNGLSSDRVPAGTTLKLPGPNRALALSALAAARNAVAQADSTAARREEAVGKLEQAEALFRAAQYDEAAKAADGAWQLVSDRAGDPTRFRVAVDGDGRTRVKASSGRPVRVEAQGVAHPVYPGQEVEVEKGRAPVPLGAVNPEIAAPPPKVPPALAVPALSSPADGARQSTSSPVTVSWAAVRGAVAYEVEVSPTGGGKPVSMRVQKEEATFPGLKAGTYHWSVRALGPEGARSAASRTRTLVLVDGPLKLEVGKTQWQ